MIFFPLHLISPMSLEQTLQTAITHHKAGEWGKAEQLYRSILSEQANHPDANHNLGVLLKKGDKADIALPFFKTALESNPNQGQYWISYIDALIHLGRLDAARSILEQGQSMGLKGGRADQLKDYLNSKVKPSPESVDTHKKSANTAALVNTALEPAIQLRESGDYQKAHAWLEDWNLKHPNDPEAIAHLAHLLLLFKKDDLALKKLNQALSMTPDSALVQRNLARIYLKKNKPNDALIAATKAFGVDSSNHENRLVLASALTASGENIKALEIVESIIKTNNDYAEAYALRAVLRLQSHDIKNALIDCKKALSIKPHLVQLWALSAKLYYQEKSLLNAISALEQALVIEPDNIDYMIDIGEFYRQVGKTEQSLSILNKAVELAPEIEHGWINYGTVLQQLERLSEAKVAYHHALKINPNKVELLNNLGAMAKSAGDLEESVEYFTKAIQLNPESAAAHSNLGATLKELGQLEEAVKRYEQALVIKPDFAEAQCNLGSALKDLGQLKEAVKSYEQALTIKADFVDALIQLGIYSWIDQDLDKLKSYITSKMDLNRCSKKSLKFVNPYLSLLTKLHKYRLTYPHQYLCNDQSPVMHVIGDSHCLTAANSNVEFMGKSHTMKSNIIIGCKAWHLANNQVNGYKKQFETMVTSIPNDGIVIIIFGEIDCRLDEGILKFHQKMQNNLADSIKDLVERYTKYIIEKLAGSSRTIIVSGVPCISKSRQQKLPEDNVVILSTVLNDFNNSLKTTAINKGLKFLDIYSLTQESPEKYFIDDHHYTPSALVKAMETKII
jgi:tetratricopeptide (TPR) repeat protein